METPKGTRDILPAEARQRFYLEKVAREVFESYGYQPIVNPIFEYTELFIRGVGEATDIVQKEMYTFKDKGGRSLTLRPEGTAPVVRAFIEHSLASKFPLPIKLYYVGSMYRFERPQAGRSREFWQLGVECLGSASPEVDAEIVLLLIQFLKQLGLKGYELQLNSMGCSICREPYLADLKKFLQPKKELCESCQKRLLQNPLRVFDCKNKGCQKIIKQAPVVVDYLCASCGKHYGSVKALLEKAGVTFTLNPFLVRGLDYYTRTTFEVVSPLLGAQNALGGGGRYDGLAEELGGSPTPGIGFAAGVERILLHAEKSGVSLAEELPPLVFVAFVDEDLKEMAFELTNQLRQEGLWVQMDLKGRKLRQQVKLADKLGAQLCVFVGPEEASRDAFKLRNMESGGEVEVSQDKIVEEIKTYTAGSNE